MVDPLYIHTNPLATGQDTLLLLLTGVLILVWQGCTEKCPALMLALTRQSTFLTFRVSSQAKGGHNQSCLSIHSKLIHVFAYCNYGGLSSSRPKILRFQNILVLGQVSIWRPMGQEYWQREHNAGGASTLRRFHKSFCPSQWHFPEAAFGKASSNLNHCKLFWNMNNLMHFTVNIFN